MTFPLLVHIIPNTIHHTLIVVSITYIVPSKSHMDIEHVKIRDFAE